MTRFFDFGNPAYRPLWVRLLIVGSCLGWAVFELRSGQVFWATLFGGIGLYAGYHLFVVFPPEEKEPEKPASGDAP